MDAQEVTESSQCAEFVALECRNGGFRADSNRMHQQRQLRILIYMDIIGGQQQLTCTSDMN